jgi:hypothetical protein
MDGPQPPLCLDDVLARLYESEINFCVSAFWDCGINVKLGGSDERLQRRNRSANAPRGR